MNRSPRASLRRPFRLAESHALHAASLLFVVAASLAFGTGCETSCSVEHDQAAEEVTGGTTVNGVYESNPWDDGYFEFPPQKRYDFVHGLGGVPGPVLAYVGFDECGNTTVASGNIVIFEEVTDTHIRVRNDTCETFCLRVVALLPPSLQTPPAESE